MPSRIDPKDVASAVHVSSFLFWVPHLVGVIYNAWTLSASAQLTVAFFCAITFATTGFVGTRCSGDLLMVVMFVIGLSSELVGIGSTESPTMYVSRNYWLVISAVQGVVSAVLCKAKDMHEGRYSEYHTVADRLYLVTPFTVGIWCAYVLAHGMAGFMSALVSIFLCLALVGYGAILHRLLAWSGIYTMDLIAIVNRIFTTSFGAVFVGICLTFVFASYLVIPFATALLELNGVLTVMGILIEVLLYDSA